MPIDKKPICITFVGVVGSSKTPITNYLSTKLNLPVYNNDALRSEVIEDLGVLNQEEFIQRRNIRLSDIITSQVSFIADVSVDREWLSIKEKLISNNYQFFIISLDLSKDLLTRLYQAKNYIESLSRLDQLLQEHQDFLNQYSQDVSLHISDNDFPQRLSICYQTLFSFLKRSS